MDLCKGMFREASSRDKRKRKKKEDHERGDFLQGRHKDFGRNRFLSRALILWKRFKVRDYERAEIAQRQGGGGKGVKKRRGTDKFITLLV